MNYLTYNLRILIYFYKNLIIHFRIRIEIWKVYQI